MCCIAALLERLSGLLVNTKDRRVFFINNFDLVSVVAAFFASVLYGTAILMAYYSAADEWCCISSLYKFHTRSIFSQFSQCMYANEMQMYRS